MTGSRILDELEKLNQNIEEVKAKLEKIEQNTKIGVVS